MCKFKHNCAFCSNPSQPESKCFKKSGGGQGTRGGSSNEDQQFGKAPSPIDWQAMVPWLNKYKNVTAAQALYEGFRDGFRIPADKCVGVSFCRNQQSLMVNQEVARRKISKEKILGTVTGPFKSIPLVDFVCSPLVMVPKKEPGEFRVIHNLSSPKGQ